MSMISIYKKYYEYIITHVFECDFIDVWYSALGKKEGTLVTQTRRMIARGLILKKVQKTLYVLLVKKINEPDTYELPGGGRKRNEKWVAALIRELYEELHISVTSSQCKKWGEGLLRTSHDHTENVRVALYSVRHKGRMKAKNEITEFRWIALHDLSNVPLERKTKIILWLYFRFGGGSH